MKAFIAIVVINMLLVSSVFARDTKANFSLDEAMSSEQGKVVLAGSIKFYFGEQAHGAVIKSISEVRTNKKTNAFNKSDKEACEWVFLSAMKALKVSAEKQGGNAVVNIRSNYKNELSSSEDSFHCGAGAFLAGVALVGDIVKIEQ